MSNKGCLSITGFPELIEIRDRVSKAVLPADVKTTLSNKSVTEAIQFFCSENDVDQDDDALIIANKDAIEEYLMERFSPVNNYKIGKDIEQEYIKWYDASSDKLNTVISKKGNEEFINDVMDISEGNARVYNLQNGKVFISLPFLSVNKRQSYNKDKIEVLQSSSTEYPSRTVPNAEWSDITLAVASDFNTKGEKLTKKAAGNKYVPIKLDTLESDINAAVIKFLETALKNDLSTDNIKLNIAGNGIYSLSNSQDYYDDLLTKFVKALQDNGVTISEIRSGGQTGMDEAGIKAAMNLGIKSSILTTSNYKFRTKDGKDIVDDKEAFMSRFVRKEVPSVPKAKTVVKTSKPKNFEQTLSLVDKIIEGFRARTKKADDFEKSHVYYVDGKKADMSVTSYISTSEFNRSSNHPAAHLGNTWDRFLRDFFSPKGLSNNLAEYANLDRNRFEYLKSRAEEIKRGFDLEFGKDNYKVYSESIPLSGTVVDSKGNTLTVAGEPDLLVVTYDKKNKQPRVYVYDMKCKSNFTSADKDRYTKQLNMYGEFLKSASKYLTVNDYRLILAKATYPSTEDSDIKLYSVETDNYGHSQVYYNNEPIQNLKSEEYNISVEMEDFAFTGTYIYPLTNLSEFKKYQILEQDMSSMTPEEMEAMGVDQQSLNANIEQVKRKASSKGRKRSEVSEEKSGEERESSEKRELSEITATIRTSHNNALTNEEIIKLGVTVSKNISNLLDYLYSLDIYRGSFLGYNEEVRERYPEDYFTGENAIPRKDALRGSKGRTLYKDLLGYIRELYFNVENRDDNLIIDDPELYTKLISANENFSEIVAAGKAALRRVEDVNISGEIGEILTSDYLTEYEDATDGDVPVFDVDSRTTSMLGSMNKTVKRVLSMLPVLDENENPVGNRFGMYEYRPLADVALFLVQNLRIYDNSDKMLEALTQLSYDDASLKPIIYAMNQSPVFKTLFFSTFFKAQNEYQKQTESTDAERNTVYSNTPLAKDDTTQSTFNKIQKAIIEGSSSLFDLHENSKIGKCTVNQTSVENFKNTLDEISETSVPKDSAKKRAAVVNKLNSVLDLLSDMGFDTLSDRNIIRLKVLADNSTSRNSVLGTYSVSGINKLVSATKRLLTACENCNTAFVPYQSQSDPLEQKVYSSLYGLTAVLSKYKTVVREASGYDDGKNYQTYSNPSYLSILDDTLKDSNEKFFEFMEKEILPYQQFVLNSEKTENDELLESVLETSFDGMFISSWLRKLYSSSEARKQYNHKIQTSVAGTAYSKLTDTEYDMAMMTAYFTPLAENSSTLIRQFVLPVMADKNAFEFIEFAGYNGSQMKDNIKRDALPFFLYELKRMRSVMEQLSRGKAEKDVEFFHIKRNKDTEAIARRWKSGKMTVNDLKYLNSLNSNKKTANGIRFGYLSIFNNEFKQKEDSEFLKTIVKYINTGNVDNISALITDFNNRYEAAMDNLCKERRSTLEKEGLLAPQDSNVSGKRRMKSPLVEHLKSFGVNNSNVNDYIEEYVWNSYLGKMNMFNITVVDPVYAPNDIELQKRYSALHSNTEKPDTAAVFYNPNTGDKTYYTDGTMRIIELSDEEFTSELANELEAYFTEKVKNSKDTLEKAMYSTLLKTIPRQYRKFDMSDGQGFTTFTGYFKKYGTLGRMTPDVLEAFKHVRENNYNYKDIETVLQPIKPFVYTLQKLDGYGDTISSLRAPLIIKNSEYLVMLAGAFLQNAKGNSKIANLMRYIESTHYNEKGEFKQDGIDTVVFHSNIKLGSSGVIDVKDATAEDIESIVKKAITGKNKTYRASAVKSFPWIDWGMQVRVPAHMQDGLQGMSSQARTIAPSDLAEDFSAEIDGVSYDKQGILDRYFGLLKEDLTAGVERVRNKIGLDIKSPFEARAALSEFLQKEMDKDTKYSKDLYDAVKLDSSGNFSAPIGDPSISSRLTSILYSTIKNNIFKEKMQGGFVVQTCSYGLEGLETVTKDGKVYMETYATFPTAYSEELGTDDNGNILPMSELRRRAEEAAIIKPYIYDEKEDRIRTYDEIKQLLEENPNSEADRIIMSDTLKVRNIKELTRILDYEMFNPKNGSARWFEADRTPGEDNYSNTVCFVKEYLSRKSGEVTIFPPELVVTTNADYDIDKNNEQHFFQKIYSQGNTPLTDDQKRKNEILKTRIAMLSNKASYEKTLNPGNFESFKDLRKELNPNDAVPSIMTVEGQIYFRRQNMLGKNMVAISALNGPSHVLGSISDIKIAIPEFGIEVNGVKTSSHQDAVTIDGIKYIQYDRSISPFDNTRVTKSIASCIGASADTAKDPTLPGVNIIPATANVFFPSLRLAVPNKIAVGILMQPNISKAANEARDSDDFLSRLFLLGNEVLDRKGIENLYTAFDTLKDTYLSYERLKRNILNPGSDSDIEDSAILLLNSIGMNADNFRLLTDMTKLNSVSAAPGTTHFNTLNTTEKILEFKTKVASGDFFSPDSYDNLFNKTHLGVLRDVYLNLVPEMMSPYFLEYSSDYKAVLDTLLMYGMKSSDFTEDFQKKLFNAYLVYRASAFGLIDSSYEGRQDAFFGTPERFKKWNVDNEFIKNISYTTKLSNKSAIPGLILSTANLPLEQVDILSSSWSDLVDNISDDASKTRKMSELLMQYNIFRGGFYFGPNTFLNLCPTSVKKSSEAYLSVFDTDKSLNFESDKISLDNFIRQFLMNNPYEKLVRNIGADGPKFAHVSENLYALLKNSDDDNSLSNPSEYLNRLFEGCVFIKLKDGMYELVDSELGVVRKVSSLGFGYQGMEYNSNEMYDTMQTVNNKDVFAKYSVVDAADPFTVSESSERLENQVSLSESLVQNEAFQKIKAVSQFSKLIDNSSDDALYKSTSKVVDAILKRNKPANLIEAAKEVKKVLEKYC